MKKMNLFLMISFVLGSINAYAMYKDYDAEDAIVARHAQVLEKAEGKKEKLEDRAANNKTKVIERALFARAQLDKQAHADSKKQN